MKKVGRIIIALLMPLFAFALIAGTFSLKAEAAPKTAADAAHDIDGVSLDGSWVAINKNGVTVDGYNLNGYAVYINANNVTVKNCSNITEINIVAGKSGIKVSGNTIIGPADNGIVVSSNGCEVSNNTITGTKASGIYLNSVSNCDIKKNTITGNNGTHSLMVFKCTSCNVTENTISDSLHYGIMVISDTNSVIKGNVVKNSVKNISLVTKELHGDGILLDDYNRDGKGCKGTQVINNKVDKVGSLAPHYGNGIIVGHDCQNILLKGNEISNAGWFGIQITYWAQNVNLESNKVYNSGNDGINISRDAYANLTGNTFYSNNGYGIVYDGHENNPSKVRVKGTASGNECYSNALSGFYIKDADVTLSGNNIHNNILDGIDVAGSSTTQIASNTIKDNVSVTGIYLQDTSNNTLTSNWIYKSSPDYNANGIVVESNAKANMKSNSIANYGLSAIIAGSNTTVTMEKNQASIAGKDGFKNIAYLIHSNDNLNNSLYKKEIETSYVKGLTHVNGYQSGAVVNGSVYPTTSADSGDSSYNIYVTFPAQSNTNNVILFTADNKENSICINAPADFHLSLGGDPAQVKAFVKRFYKEVMGREGDEGGINYWAEALLSKEKTGADVANFFALSPEFEAKNLNNDAFVRVMYKAFFNREADAGGYATWMNWLSNGRTRKSVVAEFVNSDEFKTLCGNYGINPGQIIESPEEQNVPQPNNNSQSPETPPLLLDPKGVNDAKLDEYVERLYQKVLERGSEPSGKAYWKQVIKNGNDGNGKQFDAAIAAREGFFDSPEYTAKNKSDEDFLTDVYHAFFNREPDAEGYEYWLKRMKNENYPRQKVIDEGFGHSKEFIELLESYGFVVKNKNLFITE
ncbi:MAG: DUF4214 domain-containing protein [Lachnospiraceae bacterium]|nr:DUF4214 domain-containing protein [Lachnospiraceae bacterium]